MDISQFLVLITGTIFSAFIKGGLGIGAGIFLLPTLNLVFPPITALSLTAPILLITDIFGLFYYWNEWLKGPLIFRVLLSAGIGATIGVIILPFVPVHILKTIVGFIGFFYGIIKIYPKFPFWNSIQNFLPSPDANKKSFTVYTYIGTGGLINSVANAGGPFFAIFLMGIGIEKRVFVSTMILSIFTTSVVKVVGFYFINILPVSDLILTIELSPIVLVGCWIGNYCNKRLNSEIFKKCVFWLIMMISGRVLISAITLI